MRIFLFLNILAIAYWFLFFKLLKTVFSYLMKAYDESQLLHILSYIPNYSFFFSFFYFLCLLYIYIYIIYIYIYIHKTLGWITPKFLILKWLAVTSTILSCVFSKTVFSREGVNEDLEDLLHQYYLISSIFFIFWHFLVANDLMMSAYNWWWQHFLPSSYFK